ncbi:MAG: phosphoenolpyruvate-utilizing N-terminal domain-containing protein, partial [Verrucomicrobiota bacterium]
MPPAAPSREATHRGLGVSGGVAIGRALVLGESITEPDRRTIAPDAISAEIHRLTEALGATRRDLTEIQRRVSQAMGAEEAGIFDAHLLVLEDPMLLQQVHRQIQEHHDNAEHAVHQTIGQYAEALAGVDDDYLRERAADVRDIGHRVISHLLGVSGDHDLRHLREPVVLFARDLSPAATAQLDREKVLAFVTETGGSTSHTAILARKLGLPAAVGLAGITGHVRSGDHVLVDGFGGLVIVNPTDQSLFAYGQLRQRRIELQEKLRHLRDQPAVTLDGERLTLAANIDQPEDLETVRAAGADGVGLFRSEFLFLNRPAPPEEEEQYRAYRAVVEGLAPAPVVI